MSRVRRAAAEGWKRWTGVVADGQLVRGSRRYTVYTGEDPDFQRRLDLAAVAPEVRVEGWVCGRDLISARVLPKGRRQPRYRPLSNRRRSALEAAAETLLESWRDRGVLGCSPGYRVRHGSSTREPCLRVRVAHKLDSPTHPLPREVDGFPVDVEEGTVVRAVAVCSRGQDGSYDFLSGGQPIRCGSGGAKGTLGLLVSTDQGDFGLTAAHVCTQPSVFQPRDERIGTVACRVEDDSMDAALFRLEGPRPRHLWILQSGPVRGFRRPRDGERVWKFGAGSSHSSGRVRGKSVEERIDGRLYRGLWRISRDDRGCVAREGDSGAVWVSEADGHIVALLVAGKTSTRLAYGYGIDEVQARIGLRFRLLGA